LIKTLANYVPAAAVKHGGLALFGFIGHKVFVGFIFLLF